MKYPPVRLTAVSCLRAPPVIIPSEVWYQCPAVSTFQHWENRPFLPIKLNIKGKLEIFRTGESLRGSETEWPARTDLAYDVEVVRQKFGIYNNGDLLCAIFHTWWSDDVIPICFYYTSDIIPDYSQADCWSRDPHIALSWVGEDGKVPSEWRRSVLVNWEKFKEIQGNFWRIWKILIIQHSQAERFQEDTELYYALYTHGMVSAIVCSDPICSWHSSLSHTQHFSLSQ